MLNIWTLIKILIFAALTKKKCKNLTWIKINKYIAIDNLINNCLIKDVGRTH